MRYYEGFFKNVFKIGHEMLNKRNKNKWDKFVAEVERAQEHVLCKPVV